MKAKYLLILCVMATGCGSEPDPTQRAVFPATGSVTFRGKSIPDATVRLHPVVKPDDGKPTFLPRGDVDPNGLFQLSTYAKGDGAPPGAYQVSFTWVGPLEGVSEDEEDKLKERLPRKYTSPESSGITVVINEGENQLPKFTLQ